MRPATVSAILARMGVMLPEPTVPETRIAESQELPAMQYPRVNEAATHSAINRFNEAFNRHDVDGVMGAMTADCVFESTYPPPDGTRYEGQSAVRQFWEDFFHSSPHAVFETEDLFVVGDRGVAIWVYHWEETNGERGHIRGVDVFRVRAGKVAEKLSYVKE
jgi:ketosteroid isomerase-like protein